MPAAAAASIIFIYTFLYINIAYNFVSSDILMSSVMRAKWFLVSTRIRGEEREEEEEGGGERGRSEAGRARTAGPAMADSPPAGEDLERRAGGEWGTMKGKK